MANGTGDEGWRETLKSMPSTVLGKQLSMQLVSSPKTSSGVLVTAVSSDLGQKPSSVEFSECISDSSWSVMPQYLLSDIDTG